jgi:hypothetical protein
VKDFPEWVPEEVVEFYRRECGPREHTDEYTQLATDTLCRAIKSQEMRKAWEAIGRRGDEIRPWSFAQIIVDAVRVSEQMDNFPPKEQIETFRTLTSKVKAISREFEDALGHWCDDTMLHYFGARPDLGIQELADNMEKFTAMVEENRRFLTDRTGKPNSRNAKRTFVVRVLSEGICNCYGTPLHDTVAATASIILDDNVDSETVRKIVGYSMTR